MKTYKNLYQKICSIDNLRLAHYNASKGKMSYPEVATVNSNIDYYLEEIHDMLINHTYKNSDYIVFQKFDRTKVRDIYKLPYYPDRIVHWAIMQVIEPIIMEVLIPTTCASIPNRGIHQVLNLETKYLNDYDNTKYCLKLDITKFFPSINQDIMMNLIRHKIKDYELIALIEELVYSTDSGIPIGNYWSQHFANYYLAYFDHYVKEELGIKYYIRYMDDIVILGENKRLLRDNFNKIEKYLSNNLKLSIKDNWQIYPVDDRGIDYVGYVHHRDHILLRKSSKQHLQELTTKIYNKNHVTNHDINSLYSRLGWLTWCNGFNLLKSTTDSIFKLLIDYELNNRDIRKYEDSTIYKFYHKKARIIDGKIIRSTEYNQTEFDKYWSEYCRHCRK